MIESQFLLTCRVKRGYTKNRTLDCQGTIFGMYKIKEK
jgi:hypothetical protein